MMSTFSTAPPNLDSFDSNVAQYTVLITCISQSVVAIALEQHNWLGPRVCTASRTRALLLGPYTCCMSAQLLLRQAASFASPFIIVAWCDASNRKRVDYVQSTDGKAQHFTSFIMFLPLGQVALSVDARLTSDVCLSVAYIGLSRE